MKQHTSCSLCPRMSPVLVGAGTFWQQLSSPTSTDNRVQYHVSRDGIVYSMIVHCMVNYSTCTPGKLSMRAHIIMGVRGGGGGSNHHCTV